MPSLREILTVEYWRHFVLACRILTHYRLTEEQVSLADAHLLQFCNKAKQFYAGGIITPNQCHCILYYGPLHEFSCFSFERYNGSGLLGDTGKNRLLYGHVLFIKYGAIRASWSTARRLQP